MISLNHYDITASDGAAMILSRVRPIKHYQSSRSAVSSAPSRQPPLDWLWDSEPNLPWWSPSNKVRSFSSKSAWLWIEIFANRGRWAQIANDHLSDIWELGTSSSWSRNAVNLAPELQSSSWQLRSWYHSTEYWWSRNPSDVFRSFYGSLTTSAMTIQGGRLKPTIILLFRAIMSCKLGPNLMTISNSQ